MVQIPSPPPDRRRRLNPQHTRLAAGSELFRIFDPQSRYRPGPLTFRYVGPRFRFDHHSGTGSAEGRGVYYAGLSLDAAVVESFDIGVIDLGTKHLARVLTTRELDLLDLRGRNAIRSGTVVAVSAGDHALSQPWARYIYEDPDNVYGEVDGIVYGSAHSGADAVVLFERAEDALECPPGHDAPLSDPAVLLVLRRIAMEHSMIVLPP